MYKSYGIYEMVSSLLFSFFLFIIDFSLMASLVSLFSKLVDLGTIFMLKSACTGTGRDCNCCSKYLFETRSFALL